MSNSKSRVSQGSWFSPVILLACLIAALAIVVALLGWDRTIEVRQEVDYEGYSSLFVDLFIVAVIVERFIEVFNSIWRRKGRVERVRSLENAVDEKARIKAQKELDAYRARTETLAMYSGFAIGIILGICGFHILQEIFEIGYLSPAQKAAFIGVDIVLTAGLIAGGSKGINAVTSLVGEFLSSSREQVEKKKPK